PLRGPALQVGHFLGLLVGAVLATGQFVLGLALALLLTTLATQACVIRQVAGCLLGPASDLVNEAHIAPLVRVRISGLPGRSAVYAWAGVGHWKGMTPSTLVEQLIKYLTDVHSIERQALVQMKAAPKLVDDPALQEVFSRHETETQQHEQMITGLL